MKSVYRVKLPHEIKAFPAHTSSILNGMAHALHLWQVVSVGLSLSLCHYSLQGPQDIGWRSLRCLLQALIPSLLMNVHIVGLNQIFDVEIDKVNLLMSECVLTTMTH